MANSIISEGKTTAEAIENGLKKLHVSKDKVDVKVLENTEKRSFFSILAPRVVKVELTVKENIGESDKQFRENNKTITEDKNVNLSKARREEKPIQRTTKTENKYQPREKTIEKVNPEDMQRAYEDIEKFLQDFKKSFHSLEYEIKSEKNSIYIELKGEEANKLIGYRGETLNSMQTLITAIANKKSNSKIHIILNIGEYREKRRKALEELAEKISKTVLRTGRQITLEPMSAYERKVIHTKLQENNRVRTYSVGEEPYRKIVIAKK